MDTIKRFFIVYEVGVDCAVRLSCLLIDLPEGKDVDTAGSPFSEVSLNCSLRRMSIPSVWLIEDTVEVLLQPLQVGLYAR